MLSCESCPIRHTLVFYFFLYPGPLLDSCLKEGQALSVFIVGTQCSNLKCGGCLFFSFSFQRIYFNATKGISKAAEGNGNTQAFVAFIKTIEQHNKIQDDVKGHS